ncbi:hypothetical protein [Halogranum rubrum]|nr:hypothetical protein [Halogranum rubrum]
MTALLLYYTLGSGFILAVTDFTPLTVETVLFWHPSFLSFFTILVLAIGVVCGVYWPVFNGDSRQRERDLLLPRRDCVKWLAVGLCFLTPFSLINVITITDWLTNLLALSGLLLVCVYTYAYGVGSAPEPAT